MRNVLPRFDWLWSFVTSWGILGILVFCASGRASAENEPPAAKAADAPARPSAGRREFTFKVLTTDGKPVAGAVVVPWAVLHDRGSFGVEAKLFPEFRSGEDGTVRVVFPSEEALEKTGPDDLSRLLRDGIRRGLDQIALTVEHPDHPTWSKYVPDGATLELVPSATVVIRAHRPDGQKLTGLYPLLGHSIWSKSDWSESDGIVTIRRVDLSSDQASRWLRLLRLPAQGTASYSEMIDLQQHAERPVTLDLELKPGVRFIGRLSGDVPRPIRNGRIIAQIVTGENAWTNWQWSATAEVDADGKFALDSLPPDEHVQLIALCDDWISTSPTAEELAAYAAENGFKAPQHARSMPGYIFGRLYRIDDRAVVRLVPMERTAGCIVTVVDSADKPVAGARVDFWPNQVWHNSGSQILGTGIDFRTFIREDLAGKRPPVPSWNQTAYTARTDARGQAKITGLPMAGAPSGDFNFIVTHDDYGREVLFGGEYPKVTITAGETGQTTFRLKAK